MCHGAGCSDIVHFGKCQAKTLFLILGNCTISNLLHSICFKTFRHKKYFSQLVGSYQVGTIYLLISFRCTVAC